jgi:hypothetical protein
MKYSPPRWVALTAFFLVLVLPSAFAMDIMERIVTTQTQSIRREATEYQRKVAEANARAYMAARLRGTTSNSKTAKTDHATPKPGKKGEPQDKQQHALKAKLPRYVAVDTVKDKRSAPGTKKDVMIWDTQSESLVGNSVYDVTNVPAIGSTAKFETYSAQYIGTGREAGVGL